jgi:hypothetical protein
VQLDRLLRVGNIHRLCAEIDAARHVVRLREALAVGVEHLRQRRLADGRVAHLRREKKGVWVRKAYDEDE